MKWNKLLWAAWVLALVLAVPLWAQMPKKPGNPPRPDSMIVYGSYIGAFIGLMAVGIGAFKISKRGHQD